MMKTKLIAIGVVLIGIVSACGTNDSEKNSFDVHKLDGLYYFKSGYHKKTGGTGYNLYWTSIHYPSLQVCTKIYEKHTKLTAKIVHTDGIYYKAEKINGKDVKDEDITFTLKAGLNFAQYKNGKRLTAFVLYADSDTSSFNYCMENAEYSKYLN